MEIILLERIKNLGQLGDKVSVKAGYARNFLLPMKKALRANNANLEIFKNKQVEIEAKNLETKKEAEKLLGLIKEKKFVLIRSAAESGALYGSVTARDIQTAMAEVGIIVKKSQVDLNSTIKEIGINTVPLNLHPEVSIEIEVNVARSSEEAVSQEIQNNGPDGMAESQRIDEFFEKEADVPDSETAEESAFSESSSEKD